MASQGKILWGDAHDESLVTRYTSPVEFRQNKAICIDCTARK